MARFSQGLLQGLMQPAFGQNLYQVGRAAAAGPAMTSASQRMKEQREQSQRGITGGLFGMEQAVAEGADTQDAIGSLVGLGATPEQIAAAQERGRATKARTTPITRASYFASNPQEEAELYKNFKSSSVENYINGTGVLAPLDKQDKPKISEHAVRLREEGYVPGSDEFKLAMKNYNESIVSGRAKGMSYKGPLEQTSFLNDELRKHPLYESTVNITEKVNKAESLKQGVNEGDSEQIRLMERTVSELYNSDSRAASEIDRLLEGRGVSERFSNWVVQSLTGDVTQETKDTLFAVVDTSKRLARRQQAMAVKSVSDSFADYVDSNVASNWSERNKDAPVIEAMTEEAAIQMYLNQ
mgnify:CR=1 FL=1